MDTILIANKLLGIGQFFPLYTKRLVQSGDLGNTRFLRKEINVILSLT